MWNGSVTPMPWPTGGLRTREKSRSVWSASSNLASSGNRTSERGSLTRTCSFAQMNSCLWTDENHPIQSFRSGSSDDGKVNDDGGHHHSTRCVETIRQRFRSARSRELVRGGVDSG